MVQKLSAFGTGRMNSLLTCREKIYGSRLFCVNFTNCLQGVNTSLTIDGYSLRCKELSKRLACTAKKTMETGDDCMKFLLTNDDGISSPGLAAIVDVMKQYGEVFVVCPDRDQSGVGHSITFREPLQVQETTVFGEDVKAWTVSGTPADCVKVALDVLLPDTIDFVVSGMNLGSNVGRDSYYSGTIGAAREATYYGLPAVAVSLDILIGELTDFKEVGNLFNNVIGRVLKNKFTPDLFLNINIPNLDEAECKGVKLAELDFGIQRNSYIRESTPSGGVDYWLKGQSTQLTFAALEGDFSLLQEGYITVTPLEIQMTNRRNKETVEAWFTESLVLQ